MNEGGALFPTLDRLFTGPRESVLTIEEFLQGLDTRSYAFAVAALNIINVVPTGIPWLSTITGVPMLLLIGQYFLGQTVPTLPDFVGRRGLQRGRLQDGLSRIAPWLRRIERRIHPRSAAWVTGMPRKLLLTFWTIDIIVLALPIPFDNFFPAVAILFFCLALIEGDGVMAMLGWLFTAITAVWTVFLLIVGHAVILKAFEFLFQ